MCLCACVPMGSSSFRACVRVRGTGCSGSIRLCMSSLQIVLLGIVSNIGRPRRNLDSSNVVVVAAFVAQRGASSATSHMPRSAAPRPKPWSVGRRRAPWGAPVVAMGASMVQGVANVWSLPASPKGGLADGRPRFPVAPGAGALACTWVVLVAFTSERPDTGVPRRRSASHRRHFGPPWL